MFLILLDGGAEALFFILRQNWLVVYQNVTLELHKCLIIQTKHHWDPLLLLQSILLKQLELDEHVISCLEKVINLIEVAKRVRNFDLLKGAFTHLQDLE